MNLRRTVRGSDAGLWRWVMFPFKAYIVVALVTGVLTGAFGIPGPVPVDGAMTGLLEGIAYGYVMCVFILGVGALVAGFRMHDRPGMWSALLWVAVGVLVAFVIWQVVIPVPTKMALTKPTHVVQRLSAFIGG